MRGSSRGFPPELASPPAPLGPPGPPYPGACRPCWGGNTEGTLWADKVLPKRTHTQDTHTHTQAAHRGSSEGKREKPLSVCEQTHRCATCTALAHAQSECGQSAGLNHKQYSRLYHLGGRGWGRGAIVGEWGGGEVQKISPRETKLVIS